MGIVCILVSWLYSFGFVVNAFVATVNDIALAGYATASQQEANAIISSKAALTSGIERLRLYCPSCQIEQIWDWI